MLRSVWRLERVCGGLGDRQVYVGRYEADARRNHGDRRRTAPRSGKSLAKSTVACI